jgi:hypothetical protein
MEAPNRDQLERAIRKLQEAARVSRRSAKTCGGTTAHVYEEDAIAYDRVVYQLQEQIKPLMYLGYPLVGG